MTFQPTIPRGPVSAMFSSPGPIYSLPPLIGYNKHDTRSTYIKAPAYQIGKRTEFTHNTLSPGPKYNFQKQPVYRDGKVSLAHAYIFGRAKDVKPFDGPGPSTYYVNSGIACSYPAPPKYTFGRNLDENITEQTPAANAYTLPPVLCKTYESNKLQPPVYSINSSARDKNLGYTQTPGPNSYKTVDTSLYLNKPPAYSILKRIEPLTSNTTIPGPAAHYEELQWMQPKKKAAAYSFGTRHSPYVAPVFTEFDE
ncbi:outer dense fiber protein 3-B [Octopus bimaculoides]|uniref:Uncharacterized protein n=1 Tax=Octopus bimaculoides TaxID=37653 RepID=A0A0L8G401_OCTBM|nr:outer dense fiber protein 3-B [Octopus bimaculoides]XP_014784640.1 outer dense fiber protein 3-B [Octopus bimaculoides]XP_014784641.1 outer dense fiber protein 3-B [Octopus bimaculoides]XP_014784642.1 outer dense fiber protein 3-B [Octopus bimaculoides]XP_014784644.1 outer dense fiber protein 3-B [Octopus bimaculoides]|eukprot:XP_014784639.1 PREDICTED: outer dense fiber protein 3-B-like [Octopus bimaculoides]